MMQGLGIINEIVSLSIWGHIYSRGGCLVSVDGLSHGVIMLVLILGIVRGTGYIQSNYESGGTVVL